MRFIGTIIIQRIQKIIRIQLMVNILEILVSGKRTPTYDLHIESVRAKLIDFWWIWARDALALIRISQKNRKQIIKRYGQTGPCLNPEIVHMLRMRL